MTVRACARCLLDTTLASIHFDAAGVCNYCHSHDRLAGYYRRERFRPGALERVAATMRRAGEGREYDCIVGVSGGVDSSFVLLTVKDMGLRPLAVHFDNGWDTDEAVTNIRRITDGLKVDLHTFVVDWQEFRSLQVAFLKASVPCVETPTDVGIHGALMRVAAREKIRFIIGGQSFATEGTVPREWGYLDGIYIDSVNRASGTAALRSFPNVTLSRILHDTLLNGIRQVPLLNYLDYDKVKAREVLTRRFDWQPYGANHYENVYSRFASGWLLPRKFHIDKRKVYLSGPVRSGLVAREEARRVLAAPPDVSDELASYCVRKLELTPVEFDRIMALPVKSYRDYRTSDAYLRPFKGIVGAAVGLGLFTPVLYEKYCR